MRAMAASMIGTRIVCFAPNTLTRSAVNALSSSSSSAPDGGKVAAARRLSIVQDGIRSLGRTHMRPIGSGNDFGVAARRTRIRRRIGVQEQKNGVLVRAERGDKGLDSNRDEDGVIKDMELYLDDLSLEYESVWDTKPAWCQPWTIVITGLGVICGSWLSFQNIVVTGGAFFVTGFWWFSFLYAYPLAYKEMIAERRKNVDSGSEDTFGTRRVQ